jgi:Ger(x)C family germination protein
MKKKFSIKFVILIILTAILLWSFIGSKGELVENLSIPIGIGMDIKKDIGKEQMYKLPFALYVFDPSGNIISSVITGEANSIGETREDRQVKNNKRYLLGVEKVYVISEDFARGGLHEMIDILVHNPEINDRAFMTVCRGKAEDILKYKIEGYANSTEFIEGMIKNSKYFNFFAPQYTMMDLIVRMDAEGRNTILPYIEIKEKGLEITGIAVFKQDKMVAKLDIKEARIVNLLRENKVQGMLDIQKGPKEYINYYVESKRKIKCYKEGGKFKFVINLNLKGTIVSNELYKNFNKDPKVLKEFTKEMESSIKKTCEDFINKSKGEYKMDFLDLGRIAAAKYGRESGVDWNKVICESKIEVNVKVKVDTEGRGKY